MQTPKPKKCPHCKTGTLILRVPKPMLAQRVGKMTVTDGAARVRQCSSCREYDLTARQLVHLERRAAAVALREGPQEKIDGDVIKYARKALGLRQAELAKLLDSTPETISRWENGERDTPRTSQLALVALLEGARRRELDVKALLAGVRPPTNTPSGNLEIHSPERRRRTG
jgi:DNA-binding transcriptional regulator YiaG